MHYGCSEIDFTGMGANMISEDTLNQVLRGVTAFRLIPFVGEEIAVWYGSSWMKGKVVAVNAAVNQFDADIGIGYNHLCFVDKEDIEWHRVKKEVPTTEIKLDKYDIIHTTDAASYIHRGYRTTVEKSADGVFYSVKDVDVIIKDMKEKLKEAESRILAVEAGYKERCGRAADLARELATANEEIDNLSVANEVIDDSRMRIEKQLCETREKCIELQDWKESAIDSRAAWDPIWEWACSHKDAKLGCSVPELVMELIGKMERRLAEVKGIADCDLSRYTTHEVSVALKGILRD